MTENQLRKAVIETATAWHGCNEYAGSHRQIIDIYNAIRPLPRGYKMTYADPWCAAFVSAVGAAVGLTDVILPECACDPMIAAYKARGRWRPGGTYPAQPGDIIFYDWGKDGSSDHVGIVIDAGAGWYTVIEGNYSDAVSKRQVQHGYEHIIGFAVPDYESVTDGSQETSTAPQSGAAPEGAVDMSDAQDGAETRETCSVTLPVLRYGDTGEAVRAAQGILIAHGVSVGPDKADGDFGHNTRNGVCNFQRSRGLAVHGVIDVETWRALLGV